MSRRDHVVLPIILDKESSVPLSRQIYQHVSRAIGDGAIGRGARLPSTRAMARLLGISRNTVFTAYSDLVADDLIRGERGAGMRVIADGAAGGSLGYGLRQMVGEAHYPARVFAFTDPDGNPLYLNF